MKKWHPNYRLIFLTLITLLIILLIIFLEKIRNSPSSFIPKETILNKPVESEVTSDSVIVTSPSPHQTVGQEFTLTGKARGTWYFEASFPVILIGEHKEVLAKGIATAVGDWMTTEFVPFKVTLKITTPYVGKATLILRKDNPSGLPQNDASFLVPVIIQ